MTLCLSSSLDVVSRSPEVSLLGLEDRVGSSEFAVSNVPLLRKEAATFSARRLVEERPNCSASCDRLADEPFEGVRDTTFCSGIMVGTAVVTARRTAVRLRGSGDVETSARLQQRPYRRSGLVFFLNSLGCPRGEIREVGGGRGKRTMAGWIKLAGRWETRRLRDGQGMRCGDACAYAVRREIERDSGLRG